MMLMEMWVSRAKWVMGRDSSLSPLFRSQCAGFVKVFAKRWCLPLCEPIAQAHKGFYKAFHTWTSRDISSFVSLSIVLKTGVRCGLELKQKMSLFLSSAVYRLKGVSNGNTAPQLKHLFPPNNLHAVGLTIFFTNAWGQIKDRQKKTCSR